MKRGKTGGRKIFIIIIGCIIACILTAIAIPLYTDYIEKTEATEATSIVGKIIISQKIKKQRTGKYYKASTIAEFKSQGIDTTGTRFFTYETAPTPNGGFIVTATPTDAFGAGEGPITYTYDPTEYPPGRWGNEELPMKDWLLT